MTQPSTPRKPQPSELVLLADMLKAIYIRTSKQKALRVKELITGAADLDDFLVPAKGKLKTLDHLLYRSKDLYVSELFFRDRVITDTVNIFISAIDRGLGQRSCNIIFSRARKYLKALKEEMRQPQDDMSKATNRSDSEMKDLLEYLKEEIYLKVPEEENGYSGVRQQRYGPDF